MNEDRLAEDRLAIRELIEAFADAIMRRDEISLGGTFAVDGTWTVTSLKIHAIGRDAIVRAYLDVMASIKFAGVFANPALLGIRGNSAEARCYQQEFIFRKDGTSAAIVGQYDDNYVARNGCWYFRSRVHSILNEVPGIGWAGQG